MVSVDGDDGGDGGDGDGGDGGDGDGGDGGRSSIVSAPASLRRSRHRPRSDATGPGLSLNCAPKLGRV